MPSVTAVTASEGIVFGLGLVLAGLAVLWMAICIAFRRELVDGVTVAVKKGIDIAVYDRAFLGGVLVGTGLMYADDALGLTVVFVLMGLSVWVGNR